MSVKTLPIYCVTVNAFRQVKTVTACLFTDTGASRLVRVDTDMHQITGGFSMPRLMEWFSLPADISFMVIPMVRARTDGNIASRATFLIFKSSYKCRARSLGCEIMVFKKARQGDHFINMYADDIPFTRSAIETYVNVIICEVVFVYKVFLVRLQLLIKIAQK